MSEYVVMPASDWQGICDATRSKTGTTDLLKSGEVAEAIEGIQVGGVNDAFMEMITGYVTVFSQREVVSLRGCLFYNDKIIQEIYLPNCVTVGMELCRNATNLKKVVINAISNAIFVDCAALEALIIPSKTLVPNQWTNAFVRSAIASGTGYIYVPAALIEEYKAATNWATYADQFRTIEGSEYE